MSSAPDFLFIMDGKLLTHPWNVWNESRSDRFAQPSAEQIAFYGDLVTIINSFLILIRLSELLIHDQFKGPCYLWVSAIQDFLYILLHRRNICPSKSTTTTLQLALHNNSPYFFPSVSQTA